MTENKKLPKIKSPIFEAVLPSTGETVKYRTFTVKEEKILLIAQESDSAEQALISIKQIVNNCLLDIDIDDLAMFDLEYMLLAIRSKSVDNKVEFTIKDPDTDERVQLELDLNDVKIQQDEEHSKEFKIDDEYTIFMRYPSIEDFSKLVNKGVDDQEVNFQILVKCIDKLANEDEVYIFDEFSQEEKEAFVDDLDPQAIEKIKKFFLTMPVLRHQIHYTDKNEKEKTFVIEGMRTFFI